MYKVIHMTYKLARRIVIVTLGVTVLLLGLALTVLPGPALLVIPLGLAILSLEFAWARHWLKKFKDGADHAITLFNPFRRNRKPPPPETGPGKP